MRVDFNVSDNFPRLVTTPLFGILGIADSAITRPITVKVNVLTLAWLWYAETYATGLCGGKHNLRSLRPEHSGLDLECNIGRKQENITRAMINMDNLFPEDRNCRFIVCMFVVNNLTIS